ncbi:MBL fold metallo-hydrolase [Spongiibacter sp. KMU-166]|uniref:MBL fold metallo-hydrolase n=1 Tax=Spongiibacter thalassae TaxID=2721624 RepID=A0ABX1GER5_9GAMM|nr:MBL fold metallo-hydrolase [Spongiibacter thalassae]NKI17690.1 MBL fold metallo-hydrolase [Spongiibacter thalassae]
MQAGELSLLRPGIHRLVAPNPGIMTGPGTNTYLLGRRRITVLDPGPAMPEHIAAINEAIAALGGELEQVLVTHTHPDHSPAARVLAEQHGVPLLGATIADDGHQDTSFKADVELSDGLEIDIDGDILRAVYTPGHVGNHYCFFHDATGLLFTGDHIMQGSTVVIIPPAGDMADYMASLRKMLAYPLAHLAPGHGDLIDAPQQEIEGLIVHRQKREDKISSCLSALGEADLDALVVPAYDDVSAEIHPIAKLSLLAHLLKLQKEGKASVDGEQWQIIR